jgi:hypothetical protein
MSALSPHEKRTRNRPTTQQLYFGPDPIHEPLPPSHSGDDDFLAALRAAYPKHNKVDYGPIKRRANRSKRSKVLDTTRGTHPGAQGASNQTGA